MKRKTRLIILFACAICFIIIAPTLVFYSMGYRFDFEKMKVTATGGIYVRSFPAAEKIIVDSKIIEKPAIFSNSVFIQSLLPNKHSVLLQKEGYYDYSKTIPVQEKEVTKLENIILIKKDISFELVTDKTKNPFISKEKFIIKNSNLYYSDSTENSELTAIQKSTPILKGVVAFAIQNNNILWVKTDGFFYKSDSSNLSLEPIKITLTPIKLIKNGFVKIIADSKEIFVNDNGYLLFLNTKTNNLENFYNGIKDAKISPDDKNMVYYDENNVYLSPILDLPFTKNLLYKSSEKINHCLWLNNDYIIINAGDKIIISEIDYRGNINQITLPQKITISKDQEINVKSPKIYYNQQENKLYILTGTNILVSEKIIP